MTALIFLILAFLAVVSALVAGSVLATVYVFQQETHLRVPTLRTRKEDLLGFLAEGHISASDTVYDLGSGNGQTVFLIERITRAEAHGVELGAVPFLFSSALKWARGSKATMHFKNLLTADISEATVVYAYLLPHMVKRLAQTIDRRMQAGSTVILCDYPFADRVPASVSVQKKHTFYVYTL